MGGWEGVRDSGNITTSPKPAKKKCCNPPGGCVAGSWSRKSQGGLDVAGTLHMQRGPGGLQQHSAQHAHQGSIQQADGSGVAAKGGGAGGRCWRPGMVISRAGLAAG